MVTAITSSLLFSSLFGERNELYQRVSESTCTHTHTINTLRLRRLLYILPVYLCYSNIILSLIYESTEKL